MRLAMLVLLWVLPLTLTARERPQVILEVLPKTLAGCTRDEVHTYEEVRYGASVSYRNDGMVVTVYAYDLDQENIGQSLQDPALTAAFDAAIQELHEAARQGSYTKVEKRDSGTAKYGAEGQVLRARFRVVRAEGADAGLPLFSEIHIFGAQGQIIKLRITGRQEQAAKQMKVLERLIPAVMEKLRAPLPPAKIVL